MIEFIKFAAIQYQEKDSDEVKVVTGYNHAMCIEWFSCIGLYQNKRNMLIETQGFVTSTGRFIDRKEAYQIAQNAGQLLRIRDDKVLYSQDVDYIHK